MYRLNFPDLKDIKKCPRHPHPGEFEAYSWIIFEVCNNMICRLTYNEDDNGKLIIDILQGGYCDHYVPCGFGCFVPATLKEYSKLQNICNNEYNHLINNLLKSNENFAQCWEFG